MFKADLFSPTNILEPWLVDLWMWKIIFLSQAPLLPKPPKLDCLTSGHYCSIWEAWLLKQTTKLLIYMCPLESLTYLISQITEVLTCSTHIRHPLLVHQCWAASSEPVCSVSSFLSRLFRGSLSWSLHSFLILDISSRLWRGFSSWFPTMDFLKPDYQNQTRNQMSVLTPVAGVFVPDSMD